nr:hypothetical transcript [Hymenolepis microstoma]
MVEASSRAVRSCDDLSHILLKEILVTANREICLFSCLEVVKEPLQRNNVRYLQDRLQINCLFLTVEL